ncbi:hypothetical protein WOLCODRAFT_140301 [Wolfiporia cocos MD-104 SS10]|uniref:Uncharacterized protein n=1 Tax=Wolfiporia cocos (strain MD-104) TaxID=742152 RepID=A0A2H3J3K7_WOLCO|nr:hypothetical protein WOLCODRAFT_140301 [Wolfiporia cocos MD-104 SS10]
MAPSMPRTQDYMQHISASGKASNTPRATPTGPRKLPTRHHTLDASSGTTPVARSPANRSQTLDSYYHAESNLLDPEPMQLFSAPASSPLDGSMSDSMGMARSLGSRSLLHSKSSSHMHSIAFPSSRIPRRTTDPESRKSSTTSADRDAGAHLDIKRLLSKPAPHIASSPSAVSLPSDSELSISSRHHGYAPKPSMGSNPGLRERESSPLHSARRGADVKESFTQSKSRDTSSSSRVMDQEKPRNVLRRPVRPSTTSSNVEATGIPARVPPRRMRSVEAFHTTAKRAVAAAPLIKTSSQPIAGPLSAGVTPARQVALAYKQQEQRREELAELSEWNDHARRLTESDATPMPSGSKLSLDDIDAANKTVEDEGSNGPYYTVFGSSSTRTAAVDGGPFDFSPYPEDEHVVKPRKSLSRKMSGRFKKVAEIVKKDMSVHHSRDDSWLPYDGQLPSLRSLNETVRMSTDERAEVETQGSHRSVLTAKHGGHDKEQGEEVRRLRSVKSVKDKERERDEGAHSSAKLWKLVKRISTGGLREKYRQSRDGAPPPVPPLPSEWRRQTESRTTLDIKDARSGGVASNDNTPPRATQPRASISTSRPSTAPSAKTSPRHTTPSRPSTGNKASSSPSVPRQSTTTRSSSPISSDMASSGYFQRTHSRSSTSSFGEEIPPVPSAPKSGLDQHILPPSELCRLGSETEPDASAIAAYRNSRKPSRSRSEPDHHSGRYSADESPPSLPLPPRRATVSRGQDSQGRDPSPTLPSFSTEGAVNNFASANLPLSEFGSVPPRPKRSSRRKPASIELPPSSVPVSAPLHSPMTPRTPRPHTRVTIDVHAASLASSSALQQTSAVQQTFSPSSISTSSSTPSSQNRSPLTFRELESPRQVWTEREKAEKWEDLLERSARAGGTLHIGESGLLSESMRLSQYSEI